MSKKASPTAVGIFVVGAIAMSVVGLLLLGGGRFFEPSKSFVLYFDGDLNGLDVGAPVTSRGVRIGEVKRRSIGIGGNSHDPNTPGELHPAAQ